MPSGENEIEPLKIKNSPILRQQDKGATGRTGTNVASKLQTYCTKPAREMQVLFYGRYFCAHF